MFWSAGSVNEQLSAEQAVNVGAHLSIVTDVFLRLIKMIIAPLVFSTLVAGIANMGVGAQLGRIGARTVAWFLGASVISLLLGLVLVVAAAARRGAVDLPLPPRRRAQHDVEAGALTLKDFVTHVFPRSIIEAMATNEILQIVVFSVFMGVALASLGERAAGIVLLAEQMVDVMLKITGYVMLVAPFAVFAAIAATIAQNGLGILLTYSKFLLSFYFALGRAVAGDSRVRRPRDRPARRAADGVDARSDPGGVFHREFGGRVPADSRTAGEIRRAAPHHPASCCRWAIRSTSTAR